AGDLGDLRHLLLGQLRVVRDVPVRAHQQMAGVVGVEVQDRVGDAAAVDDERVLVAAARPRAEGALLVVVRVLGLVLPADIRHPVRGPQPLGVVGDAREGAGVLERGLAAGLVGRAHTCTLSAIAVTIRSTASSTSMPLSWLPSRMRKETAPFSWSSPPAMRR